MGAKHRSPYRQAGLWEGCLVLGLGRVWPEVLDILLGQASGKARGMTEMCLRTQGQLKVTPMERSGRILAPEWTGLVGQTPVDKIGTMRPADVSIQNACMDG